jgi:asparagine synthase (glutamine-hydrolysing)
MLNKIQHRGTYAHGTFDGEAIVMAQNYLEADGVSRPLLTKIPVESPSDAHLRICYDGQMGNWEALAQAHGVSDGAFREERLLLLLYQKYGRAMLRYLDDAKYGRAMLRYLDDAVFAFAISDGEELFAARDLLGIKTLFYGRKDGTLCLASELKAILEVSEEVQEFPPGHCMTEKGQCIRYAELPKTPPAPHEGDALSLASKVKDIVIRSFRNRVNFDVATGSLLSGGIDSSVIAAVATRIADERFHGKAPLKTFAIGVGESEDIRTARVVAEFLRTDHHELVVDVEQVLKVLPTVIYYLESFDPSLVRSAVSNYLISQYAREEGIRVLLSGEGGDEVFCGYTYLKDSPMEELFARQVECLAFLHNNASLRLDRMNQCHGLRVIAPLVSGELLRYAMAIPPEYKQRTVNHQKIEKWIFRKAFEGYLPESVVWRTKQEFSQGSGSAAVLPNHFEEEITDRALAEAQAEWPIIRSKEELYYFRIFTGHFGSDSAVRTVGQWISL